DRVSVPGRFRPGLSERHVAEAVRGGAIDPCYQGLGRQRAASRMACAYIAESAAAGERPHHPQFVAILLADARLQWIAVRLRKRYRRFASATVSRRAEGRPRTCEASQRPHRTDRTRVLCRSIRRYA